MIETNDHRQSSKAAWLIQVEDLARQVCDRESCIFYELEMVGQGRNRVLRVYIDKDGSIAVGDCENVSKGLNLLLDQADVIPGGAYYLEVSTPGLDRGLSRAWHFAKVVGKTIWLRMNQSLGDISPEQRTALGSLTTAKKFEAEVLSADDNNVSIRLNANDLVIPFSVIEKAQLVIDIPKPQKPKGLKQMQKDSRQNRK